jgi:hypothetical protein
MFDMAIRGKELRHDGKMITPIHAKEHFRGVCSTKREEGGRSGPLPCLWSSGDGCRRSENEGCGISYSILAMENHQVKQFLG